MSKSTYLAIMVVGIVVLGNIIIIVSNLKTMDIYPSSPPFRVVDHTKSYKISTDSSITGLLDEEQETTWTKLGKSPIPIDWEIELSLTHYWDGKEFVPKKWKSIDIIPCSDTELELSIIYREAINVDKVLRLPEDFLQNKITVNLKKNKTEIIDLKSLSPLKRTSDYPEGIYILTILGKHREDHACLSKIDLEF